RAFDGFAPWGSTSKISSGSVSRDFQPGESSNKNSFSGVVSTDWWLVDFPRGLKRILVYAKLLWSRWSRRNPAPFCVLRELLIVLPFFQDRPCSVDLV